MHTLIIISIVILAYLIGSIPTAVWVGKKYHGIDIREHGSGNAGATNTFRVLGVKSGIPVLMFDIFKGWITVQFAYLVKDYLLLTTTENINLQLALGVAVLLGHIFPIYAQFKGGKGVATLLGMIIAIHPESALLALSIFVVSLLLTKYVSLSSMLAGLSFPVMIVVIYHTTSLSLVIFSMTIAVLLLFTHQKNIERLLAHEEKKVNIGFRKKKRIKEDINSK